MKKSNIRMSSSDWGGRWRLWDWEILLLEEMAHMVSWIFHFSVIDIEVIMHSTTSHMNTNGRIRSGLRAVWLDTCAVILKIVSASISTYLSDASNVDEIVIHATKPNSHKAEFPSFSTSHSQLVLHPFPQRKIKYSISNIHISLNI